MNPEPTKELKEKYFAAHWGQEVMIFEGDQSDFYTVDDLNNMDLDDWSLLLRGIKDLTDLEATEVAKILTSSEDVSKYKLTRRDNYIEFDYANHGDYVAYIELDGALSYDKRSDCGEGYCVEIAEGYNPLAAYDYLRSIGIALPFMGHSVNQLIDYGWLKLREGGVSDE